MLVDLDRALGEQIFQERGDVSLHLDDPVRRLKICLGALKPAAKCAKFNLFGALPERPALSRRETHKRPDVALLAPGGKVRGGEALAA